MQGKDQTIMLDSTKDYGEEDLLVLLPRLFYNDEYLSAVSSDPLRGRKQMLAIYLMPPEIMLQQARGAQSFTRAHRRHRKINK